jgi:hypothetical protein
VLGHQLFQARLTERQLGRVVVPRGVVKLYLERRGFFVAFAAARGCHIVLGSWQCVRVDRHGLLFKYALLRGHFLRAVRFVLNAPVPFIGRVPFAARFVVGGFPGAIVIVEEYNKPQE